MSKQKPKLAVAVTSLAASADELKKLSATLETLGQYFTVLDMPIITRQDMFDSQPVSSRITSLSGALEQADVVLAYNGGYNSVELLESFSMISAKPEAVFIGYSDNTILANALPVMRVSRGWLGPMLATMINNEQYIAVWAQNIIDWLDNEYESVSDSFNKLGMSVYRSGIMEGRIIGGNAYTFDLLQGTEYCPAFTEPFIYVLEGEDFITDKSRVWQDTVRNLDSILLQPGARDNIRGLLIGRFPGSYKLDMAELEESIARRLSLSKIPIIYDFPRGYWQPSLCLPLLEKLSITARDNNTIQISKVY